MNDNTFKEMLKEYKKVVQIPFEEYKEKTKKDKKEAFQFMVHKMANENIKLFESLEISNEYIEMIEEELEKYKSIIKEVREWTKKYSCQFTNDDGELVVSEISFNIQARPCDLFKILDKVDKENNNE